MNELKGISNITNPIIQTMLPVQLRQHKIKLGFYSPIQELIADETDFLLVDGERLLTESTETSSIKLLIQEGKPVYALLMKKDYKAKLQILNERCCDCFEFPVVSDIIAKTLRNQLYLYTQPKQQAQSFAQPETIYHVLGDDNLRKFNIEFMPAQNKRWFLRYRDQAQHVSVYEKRIISYLLDHKKTASKSELAYIAWNTFDIKDNTVIVTIKKIRTLFQNLKIPMTIRNLYGYGYSMRPTTSPSE